MPPAALGVGRLYSHRYPGLSKCARSPSLDRARLMRIAAVAAASDTCNPCGAPWTAHHPAFATVTATATAPTHPAVIGNPSGGMLSVAPAVLAAAALAALFGRWMRSRGIPAGNVASAVLGRLGLTFLAQPLAVVQYKLMQASVQGKARRLPPVPFSFSPRCAVCAMS